MKTILNLQFAVQIKVFSKNPFFCPTTTYAGLCISYHIELKYVPGMTFGPGHDIVNKMVGLLGIGVIYSEKHMRSVGHLRKLCNLFPQTAICLKSDDDAGGRTRVEK